MREIISEYESIQQSYGNVFSNLENFIEHLNRVKLIEHYFGDVEIQSLFEHTQFIAGQMVDAEKHYQDFMEKRNDNANTDQANIKSEPIKSSDKKRKGKKARNSSQH
jgi:DNA anti-recombination protein RmuC